MLSSDDPTGSMHWVSQGACQREDPELFFPFAADGPAPEQITAAKKICLGCAVRDPCLSFGLKSPQEGIWGGTTPGERRAMRRRPAAVAALHNRLAQPGSRVNSRGNYR